MFCGHKTQQFNKF